MSLPQEQDNRHVREIEGAGPVIADQPNGMVRLVEPRSSSTVIPEDRCPSKTAGT